MFVLHGVRYGGGDGGQDDAVFVLHGVAQAEGAQLLRQHAAEFELAGRTGVSAGVLDGRGVDAYITTKTIEQGLHAIPQL